MSEGTAIDSHLEAKLGFDRVRQAISDRCNTEYAAARVAEEAFSTDADVIRKRLLLTEEMRLVMMFEETFPSGGYVDGTAFLTILGQSGANIDLLSLGKLRTILDTLRRISLFFSGIKDGVYPQLKQLADQIVLFPDIVRRIDAILDKNGAVKDTASETLADIRRQLREKEGAVSRRVAAILKRAQAEGIADADTGVAVRDGKMLIPVHSVSKRKLPGFVMDESASGKTTFIQPAEVVELENEISELQFAQTREIARILSEFSEAVRPDVPRLLADACCLGEFDFLMAKALVALDYIAGLPVISEDGALHLRKARHPLLQKALRREGKEIVPLTLSLTPAGHILLISGPNAGGKSVCLKTVGLLQYMFQWGMLIPTSETSEMTVFDRIMVDIGDGQSIDNDLSTYSSFLVAMRGMLETADARTLVLIDEFGSGTEPAAGGAIAEAILSELDRRGVYGVITTHYTNLKLYASAGGKGVVNGAMLFDGQQIKPLFKLEMGLPGHSFAFELARKMGLPEAIVKDAEQRAGEEYVGLEKNLRKIARSRRVMDEKLQRIRQTDKTLETITGKYQKELEEIRSQKKTILAEAHREAKDIVKQANRQVENTIRTIRETQAEREQTAAARRELQGFVEALSRQKAARQASRPDTVEARLQRLEDRMARQQARKEKRSGGSGRKTAPAVVAGTALRVEPLKVGEKVRIKENGMVGEVSAVSAKTVSVVVGNVTTRLSADRVERISSNEYKAAVKGAERPVLYMREDPAIRERKLNFKPEIDVRGERLQDALEKVMRFVDDAMMMDVSPVRIVHGKGTGVLRVEIQKWLKTVPGVASVTDEQLQFGGTGVTVVRFG